MTSDNYLKKELYELIKTDESIFDFIQDSSLDGLWYWDLENPEEEWMNPKFWTTLGYNPDEMPHKSAAWQDIIHPDDLKIALKNFNSHCENPDHPYDQIVRYTHKNGSTVWIRCRGIAIRDEQGKAMRMLGAHMDVTKYKEAEEKLLKFNTILEESEKLSDTGSFEYLIPENKFTMSEGWLKIHGVSKKMDKETLMLIAHPDDRERIEKAFENALKNIAPYNLEHRIIRQTDGQVRTVKARGKVIFDDKGNPLRMFGSVIDITERKKDEESLLRTNTILKEAEKITKTGSWELDVQTGLSIVSDGVYPIYETEKEPDDGPEKAISFFHPDYRQVITDAISKAIAEQVSYDEKCKLITGKGNEKWVRTTGHPVVEDGKVIKLYGVITDITDQERAEQGLKESLTQLDNIVNTIPVGVYVASPEADGRLKFDYVSDRWCEIVKLNRQDVFADSSIVNNQAHPDDRDSLIETNAQAIRDQTPFVWEGRFIAGEDEVRWAHIESVPYVQENSEIRWFGFHQDITERKQAEENLLRINTILKEAEKITKTGSWELDVQTGKGVWSDEVYAIHEVDKDFDHNKENGIKFYHPDYRQVITDAISKSITEQVAYDEKCKFISAKGNEKWLRTTGHPFVGDGKVTKLYGVIADITEQERVEQALKESEENFRSLADTAKVIISIVADEKGSKYLYVNKEWSLVHGYNKEEVINLKPIELVAPESRQQLLENAAKRLKGERAPSNYEIKVFTKNGAIKYLDFSSTIITFKNQKAFLTTSIDITQRKLAEQELKNLTQMQSLLMKSASDYINVPIDLADATINNSLKELGEFVLADRAYVFSFEWEKNVCHNTYEWCNRGITPQIENLQNVPNDSISTMVEAYIKGNELYIEDVMQLPVNDSLRQVLEPQDIKSLLSVPLMIEEQCIGFIGFDYVRSTHAFSDQHKKLLVVFAGMIANLNSRKELEKGLVAAKEEAQNANKFKSEFLANMSHEIRTPMNSVIGFSELLQSTDLNATQKQYVDNVHNSATGLLDIINDILDFSKIEAGKLELEFIETDIIDLIEQAADLIKYPAGKKGVELLLNIDPQMPRCATLDPVRIRQILANLLSNALKFTEKGEIELKLSLLEMEGNRGRIRFSVRDTGIGISDAQREKLFKAFSQADSSTTRKFGGTGLGLVISDQLAQKMGGKLELTSTKGEGSEFYFTIETALKDDAKTTTPDISNIKSCLVIDDNQNSRIITEDILKRWGIECVGCDNGLESLKIIENSHPFDAILCDYQMPYLDGLETVKTIRQKLKLHPEKLPVILMHSSVDDAELESKCKCKELGIYFRLIKPVKQHQLLNCLLDIQRGELAKMGSQNLEAETDIEKAEVTDTNIYKVLIAEDNKINMILASTLIKQLLPRVELIKAENGKVALDKIVTLEPDLVFMDVQMPEMDGNEATAKLREMELQQNISRTVIVGLTAGALKEEKDKSLKSGMDDFLTKPIETDKLKSVLNKYLVGGKKQENIQSKNESGHLGNKANHFDREELLNQLGGDPETLELLIHRVIDDTDNRLLEFEKLLNEGTNPKKAASIAHSLRGTAVNFRWGILSELTEEIQKEIRLKNSEATFEILHKIKEEWNILAPILKRTMAG